MSNARVTVNLLPKSLAALKRLKEEEDIPYTTAVNQGVRICNLINLRQGEGYQPAFVKYEDGQLVAVESVIFL